MAPKRTIYIKHIEYLIIGFIFLVIFTLPVLFTHVNGQVSWLHVFKIWQDMCLLIPLFAINHWLLVPKLLFGKKYVAYILCVSLTIGLFTFGYYYHDEVQTKKPQPRVMFENAKPEPVPPYANLLLYSLLLVGVDSGLLFSKKWRENEEKRLTLEKKNTEMQLDILRNQISPHFFMNTLNNIYALIDCNTQAAKEAVMKLSKLMRYMLYENENGKVRLSKEFEFIRSYIDLMKLRFSDEMSINFVVPEKYDDIEIPPMLFISYIENAFKYGASYQHVSFVNVVFETSEKKLKFICSNSKHSDIGRISSGGLGMKNSENRLKLLFGSRHELSVASTESAFKVTLEIPIA